jgi:DinB superfamily
VISPYSRTIERVRTALAGTFAEADTWFDRPEPLRTFRPSDGGWTIDEILEHITLTSHFLMIVIRNSTRKALKRAADASIPPQESDLELLEPIGRRGTFSWARPEHMIPTGTVPGEEVRRTMREQLAECLGFLDQLAGGEGSLFKVRMSVKDSGKLDVYQWLYFVAQHAKRHVDQMRENEEEWRGQSSGPVSLAQ